MAETDTTEAPAAGPPGLPAPAKTQEELNIVSYGRVYENFLKKAEELGKSRGWTVEDILSATDSMYQRYFDDQVTLTKDTKLQRNLQAFLQMIPGLGRH